MYAKLEYYNLTGSIKDRLVYYVLTQVNLKEDTPIVTATSGNTGIALAAYGARYNHPVHIFMPDFVSSERVNILKIYGANVTLVSREDGGFVRCLEKAKEFASINNAYLFDQFGDIENINCHYNTTGLEIQDKLKYVSKFVSGVGTGGTLIGAGNRLKEKYGTKIIAIEPDGLPILSNSETKGSHKIDGIGDDFVPDIVDVSKIDEIIKINDIDAINMAKKLGRELGLGVGVSSGANFLGSVLTNKGNEEVVTVFADDNKKYLSVLCDETLNSDDFISNKIKLVNFEIIN